MSSESNGRKPDSQEPGPSSGTGARSSARVPAAWGAARDAIAAVRNLELLLRSSSLLYRTIRDLLPELRAGAGVLREAFGRAAMGGAAAVEVGRYGLERVTALLDLLEAVDTADDERDDLAVRCRATADDLEAAADLFALLERAAEPAPTEVSVDRLVREALRISGGRGHEVAVRFDEATPDCTVTADAYLLSALVSLLVGMVRAGGSTQVSIHVQCTPGETVFVFEETPPEDMGRDPISARVPLPLPPTTATLHRLARSVGGSLVIEGSRTTLRLLGSTTA